MAKIISRNNIEGRIKAASFALFTAFLGFVFLYLAAEPHAAHSDTSVMAEGEQPDSPISIQYCLDKAKQYYDSGRYQEAISFWDKALSADPGNTKAEQGTKDAEKKIAKIKNFFGDRAFKRFVAAKKFSIEDCLGIASENNIPLEVAREQIKLASIKVWEARRSFFPSLTLSWSKTSGIQSGGKVEGLEYGIEGKQPAFHSGGIMYTLAQAKADLAIAESNYDKTNNELYFEVAKAYFILIKAEKRREYVQDMYAEMKPFYEMAKKAYEKSVIPNIEFLNVESGFNQLYYQAISDGNEFELAKLNLEQKLGIEDMKGINLETDYEPGEVTEGMNKCLELALEHRPDLKMGLYAVKYTEYGKKIADTKEMPSVDLVGTYKKSSEVYREGYGGNQSQSLDPHKKWYVGMEASVPFLGSTGTYSYFRRKDPPTLSTYYAGAEGRGTTFKLGILDNIKNLSDIEQAKIANIKAEQDLEDARKKAIMEVKEAYYGYEKARIQLKSAKTQKEFREKELKILKFKKQMGENELSQVFETASKLLEADALYCDAEATLNISIAALNKAIGVENYF